MREADDGGPSQPTDDADAALVSEDAASPISAADAGEERAEDQDGACASLACGPRGRCVVADDDPPHCQCEPGYAGPSCEICDSGFEPDVADDAMCVAADDCALGLQDDDGNGTCEPTCEEAGLSCSSHQACSTISGRASCECRGPYVGMGCEECAEGFAMHPSSGECLPLTQFDILFVGDGHGSVQVPGAPGSGCSTDCGLAAAQGSVHTLTAVPGPHTRFKGWSEPSCGNASSCTIRLDAYRTISATFELAHNVAFVTSKVFEPSMLGGLGGADQKCAEMASAAGLHGQSFVAWLSTDGPTLGPDDDTHAIERLSGSRGWVRTDGLPFVDRPEDLAARGPLYPLLDEQGANSGFQAFTGTSRFGTLLAHSFYSTCRDWTGDSTFGAWAGAPNAVGYAWTERVTYGCMSGLNLYCFGLGQSDPLPRPVHAPGRLAFVSRGLIAANAGIPAMDKLCADEATAAGRQGRFRALVATSTAIPAARFNLNASTWVRTDGLAWLAQASDLAQIRGPMTGLNVDATGKFIEDEFDRRTWTGWDTTGRADTFTTCGNWTRNTGDGGNRGGIDYSNAAAFDDILLTCDGQMRVYCLEE